MDKNASLSIGDRVTSIDALRGFSMFWIIGGGSAVEKLLEKFDSPITSFVHNQMRHVTWEGFHAWDLIMPLFLFVVGCAMPFSFAKRLSQGYSKISIYKHVIIRFIILYVLGLIVQGHLLDYDLDKLVLHLNTLHAIALGYLITSIIILNFSILWQIIITVGLLLAFWAVMMLAPVPDYGRGMLTRDTNFAYYIDRLIFLKLGLIQFWDSRTGSMRLISAINFGTNVMLGAFAGQLLKSRLDQKAKLKYILLLALGCISVGLLWSLMFPMIKRLWTSSFVLYACGYSYLLLGLFYWLIDIKKYKCWSFPFVVIGMNAIAVYTATEIFNFRLVADVFVGGLKKHVGTWFPFIEYTSAFLVVWLILWWMYRKASFIKV